MTIGAELELIPLHAETRLPLPIESHATACSVDILRRTGLRNGWSEHAVELDQPFWELPGGARISFEPGGQIEVSSAPHATASSLIAELTDITRMLFDAFERHGSVLETRGVDPHNSIERTPLQLHRERYESMTRYFESIGPSGIRMMRQTASVQINIEPGDNPLERWALLNRMAPMLVAMFSNSRRYAGADTGRASYRAHLWRTLDPSRTGLSINPDAIESYADFALGAGWMFECTADGSYPSFGAALENGAKAEDWEKHVSTLFPEIRPRHYFEVRSPDMVDLPWIAAPIAMIAGVCYDSATAGAVAELLADFDSKTLVNAGRRGMADEQIASVAGDFVDLAIGGCEALGPEYIGSDHLDIVREFADRYPANGRSPSDDS